MADIGHNKPPEPLTAKGKLDRIQAVVECTDLTAAQKCVGVGIIVRADRDGVTEVKTADLMTFASAKDRETVFRATKRLHEQQIIEKANRPGQSGRYNVLPARVIEAVEAAFHDQQSGWVKPDGFDSKSGWSEPDGMIVTHPVGFNPTNPVEAVGSNPTSPIVPVGSQPTSRVSADQPRTHAHARIETPSGLLSTEEEENKNIPTSDETHSKPKRAMPRPKPTSEQFERFWDAYPKRKGKPKALERFMALAPDAAELAIAGAKAYAAECVEKNTAEDYIKWPQGWLGERRFEDYASSEKKIWWKGRTKSELKALGNDFWRQRIKIFANGIWDGIELCYPPGHGKCPLPDEVAAEFMDLYGPSQSHKWRGIE